MQAEVAILLFAKAPVDGQVKTRLQPFLCSQQATRLYRMMLGNAIDTAKEVSEADLQIYCAGGIHHEFWSSYESSLALHEQYGADLGERMYHAVEAAMQDYSPVILIGADCPQLNAEYIKQAVDLLAQGYDAVIGPATDGGYVLLGLNRVDWGVFSDIEWGKDSVLEDTQTNLLRLGWSFQLLSALSDIDRPEDLSKLPVGWSY
ncbi:MAG: TIGR04282 family arsenosugar biosynthesis glycosyltransferase [Pseudomonadales bacterium]